jgi:hypothetical protein
MGKPGGRCKASSRLPELIARDSTVKTNGRTRLLNYGKLCLLSTAVDWRAKNQLNH